METLYVRYGNDGKSMAMYLMEQINAAGRISASQPVIIKPNLVKPSPPSEGATTHPEIVRGIIEYLLNNGIQKIEIAEGSWLGASTRDSFKACGYESISRDYDIPLIDLKKESTVDVTVEGMTMKVCRKILEAGFLINVPVMKAHCQTSMTCALKNLKGCIPDSEKRRFHSLGIHRPVALLNKVLKSHLTVVDGLCGDLFFEEGGTPLPMNRIIIGCNPLNVDIYCAGLIGYSPGEIEHLEIARELGIGDGEFTVVETNTCSSFDNCLHVKDAARRRLESLTENVISDKACSACYGGLIQAISRMKDSGLCPSGEKFYIGQGFKGKSLPGIGIGNCTAGFTRSVKGCPPDAIDIIEFCRNRTV